jgi:hypothetical protein
VCAGGGCSAVLQLQLKHQFDASLARAWLHPVPAGIIAHGPAAPGLQVCLIDSHPGAPPRLPPVTTLLPRCL